MATRNGHFLKSPRGGERGGHFALGGTTTLTSFVPVIVNGDVNDLGLREVELAPEGTAKPAPGAGGILVYENIGSAGFDMDVYTYSDIDAVSPGDAVQVVTGNGGGVKVSLQTTAPSTGLLGRADYPKARVMVAGALGATATVAVGDYLLPGKGNDVDGYWKVTSTAADGWLFVTAVDPDSGVVEAEVLI